MEKLETFTFKNETLRVQYIETLTVTNGVECDVYAFIDDTSKDLAIVRVQPGHKTPLQKVLHGDETVEGHVSGEGVLRVIDQKENLHLHMFDAKNNVKPAYVSVSVGDTMQWEASADTLLTFYEVCTPPYQGGRFESIAL